MTSGVVGALGESSKFAEPALANAPQPSAGMDVVDFRIHGEEMQYVEIELDPGEAAVGEAGSMMYMDAGVGMEAVFGDGAVRALATQARRDLMDRVERLLGSEAARFRSLVLQGAPDASAAAGLRAAAADLEQARRASSAVRPAPPPPSPAAPERAAKTPWWRRGR